MSNPGLSEIITTCLRNREKKITDNFTNKNAFLKRLKSKGNIRKLDGGRTIVRPLAYAENSTFTRYSGSEVFNTSASDVITAAEYNWKQAAISVFINGLEKRQNSGNSGLFDLLEERINIALKTFDNSISSDIYSDGLSDGGRQIGGLQAALADANNTGTYGGIARSGNSFWQHYVYDASSDGGAATSAANIQDYMNQVWINTMRGEDMVDLILASNDYWIFYLSSLQAIQRIQTIGGSDAGSKMSLKFFDADVIADGGSGIGSSRMYFLNTDYISLDVHKDAFMTTDDSRQSTNQDATIVPIFFQGNITASNMKQCGLLKA